MDNDFEHYYNATIRLKEENAELKVRIDSIKADRITYCAYCGQEFPMDAGGTPEAVSTHIHNCPKHPIQDYKAEIELLIRLSADAVKEARQEVARELISRFKVLFWVDDDAKTAGDIVTGSVIYSEIKDMEAHYEEG